MSAPVRLHKTIAVNVGRVQVGGGAPVVVQSMTMTETANAQATARQCVELAEAGSEMVRVTVNTPEAAAAVPDIKRRMLDAGCDAPLIGDFPARRIAFFTGMALIFLITYVFIRRICAETTHQLFAVGFMWAILTLLFEIGLGLFVLGYSYERMFEDYDVSRGGLMGFGILFMVFAPFLAAKLRGMRRRKAASI